MHIILLGTGSALPSRKRVQAGVLVDVGELLLLDCGAGVLHRIAQSGRNHLDINHVFFTHHHLDHNSDFPALLKANFLLGKGTLDVYGPAGTKEWLVRSIEAYPYMKARFNFDIKELKDGDRVKLVNCTIEARAMEHSVLSLGYRIMAGGKSMVYTGDTEPCENTLLLCKGGVDILIHECSFQDSAPEKHKEGHTTPEKLEGLLKEINVDKLVLTHFYPDAEEHVKEIKETIARFYKGEIVVGKDLMKIEV